MNAIEVLTFGETMVSFRSGAPLVLGGRLTTRVAGSESNVAIGLARLGHSVAWAGRVGTDPFGDLILRALRAEHVDTSHAVVDPVRSTGLMFVEQRTADLTRVEYRRSGSAGSALTTETILPALDSAPRILHLTGITPALSVSARECFQSVAAAASAAGVLVSLDVNYRGRLWSRDDAREALRPVLEHTWLVIASDDELDLVAPGTEAEGVSSLMALGARLVAVKRGSRGATIHTGEGRVDLPALPVTALDPIGAGDAFSAGLLSGFLDGLEAAECLRRGVTNGAFVVATKGDWEGAPTRAELALLDNRAAETTVR